MFTITRRFLSSGRPFHILGVQQIAVGSLDKTVLSKFWVDQLGLKKTGTYKAEVSIVH
jgi:lactoylglutathione lyase